MYAIAQNGLMAMVRTAQTFKFQKFIFSPFNRFFFFLITLYFLFIAEITFGDRTVHNIPETWRCSISEETNLCSLISALSFKVCARHLHQRVPVSLGTAAPDSAKELLNSLHLRHDFDLPVIASDCLPVAQLKICLELGRDRIHFGGLLDPGRLLRSCCNLIL